MVTIHDVADKAGVSVATVSRVINNHPYVREATRQKVLTALREMSYVPNANAGSLARKSTSIIAVLVPDITNTFFTTLVRGIEDQASESGLSVILGNTDEDVQKEQFYINKFLERRVDGLVVVPVENKKKNFQVVQKYGLPLVLVDRLVEGVDEDFVGSDNYQGAYQLVNHLIELGHRQIAMVSGPKEISVFAERVSGFYAAMEDAHLPLEQKYLLFGLKPSKEVGHSLTRKLLKMNLRPTAIFAANNSLAVGTVSALLQAGIGVPEDISVACFDDNDLNAYKPFFTSVIQPAYMMGYVAAEVLLQRLKSEKVGPANKIIMQPELVVRQSTARLAR